jgi:uncharacterized protein (DUF302 family)
MGHYLNLENNHKARRTLMKNFIVLVLLAVSPALLYAADDGLISKKSHHDVKTTLDRLENILQQKGITIAMRWSHDEGGKKAGIPLRPTELLVFGNPKMGTHFFTSNQTAGIDLPMKALAWQDKDGQVWLTYNDPAYIAGRHEIKNRSEIVAKMSNALDKMISAAIAK